MATINLKNQNEIEIMHEANCIVHEILQYAKDACSVGITTGQIDQIMKEQLGNYDATSAFLDYHGYPTVSCISINSEIVHGIPGDRKIEDGDLVSIDFGVYHKGFAGDSAISFIVGNCKDDNHTKLIKITQEALFAGIEQMQVGNSLHDIGAAIDYYAKLNNFGNVRNYCGHGIGHKMHEKPSVFNYVEPRETNIKLRPGLVLALEPMFVLGSEKTKVKSDGWTVITKDNSIAAHWELSVAITDNGPRILGHSFDRV